MEVWDGFDLGYDLGFEDGSWAGFFYAIDRLKLLRVRREALIVTGTIISSVSLTLLGVKVYNHIKAKSKLKYKTVNK